MEATVEEWVARLRARLAVEPTLGPALAVLLAGAVALVVVLQVRGSPPGEVAATAGGLPACEPSSGQVGAVEGGTTREDEAPPCSSEDPAPVGAAPAPAPPTAEPAPATLMVHVAGAVGRPGLVELSSGARVADAVAAAGGLALDADPGALNLAQAVADGEQVVVPRLGEPAPPPSGPAVAGDDGTAVGGPVDLNTATPEQLETLDGIGPVLAARIVAHRTERGPFADVTALREVSGIGELTFERLAPHVTVS